MSHTATQSPLSTIPSPMGSLNAYIQTVNNIPMLTADQERELALTLKQSGDLEAARQLISSHLRFVVRIANGYSGYNLNVADLIQEGNIGLMKAVKRFDPDMQVRLVSFAVHWVRADMHEFILRNWRIAKIATTKAQRKLFFNLRRNKKRLGWFNQQEIEAVAKELGVKPETVVEMEARLNNHDISFDPLSEDDDDDELGFSPATYLASETTNPAIVLEAEDWKQQSLDYLSAALSALDARSRDIVEQRWLQDKKITLQQLAKNYEVSIERIRQIEQAALGKLKSIISS